MDQFLVLYAEAINAMRRVTFNFHELWMQPEPEQVHNVSFRCLQLHTSEMNTLCFINSFRCGEKMKKKSFNKRNDNSREYCEHERAAIYVTCGLRIDAESIEQQSN